MDVSPSDSIVHVDIVDIVDSKIVSVGNSQLFMYFISKIRTILYLCFTIGPIHR